MKTHVMLALAVAVWLGAAAGLWIDVSAVACATIGVALALFARRSLLLGVLAALCAGAAAAVWRDAILEERVRAVPEGDVRLEGTVWARTSAVEPEAAWMSGARTPRFRTMLRVDRVEATPIAPIDVELSLPSAPLEIGARIGLVCQVVRGRAPLWALERDESAAQRRRGVAGTAIVRSADLISVLPAEPPWWTFPAAVRASWATRLDGSRGGRIAAAIVLGERSGLSREELRVLSHGGVVHALSVSGLHVGVLAAALLAVFRVLFAALIPFAAVSARRLAAITTALLVCAYVVISGADAPAVRSLVMAAALLLGGSTKRALALALTGMLVVRPEEALDLSFVFSFAGMFALVVFLPQRARGRSKAFAFVLANALPFVIGAPLSAFVFHEVPTAGLLLNVAAVPLSSLMVLAGFVWIVAPVDLLTQALVLGGEAFHQLAALAPGWSVIDVALWPHELLVTVVCACSVCAGRGRVMLVVTAMTLCLPWAARRCSSDVVLHTLPVGQGDGHVLFLPGGRTIVIDAGGSYDGAVDPGRRVVLPFLRAWRVHTVDALILTHAHPDHFGGMLTLAERLDVRRFVWNGQAGGRAFERLREALPARGVAGVAELRLLHPLGEPYFPELSLNDNSLVYLLSHGGNRVLLTGDAEAIGEDFIETGPVDVLKVGHHGSSTSTGADLLARSRPKHAIISAGAGNTFGHPHPDVLRRLEGTRVWRTDINGHITTTLRADGGFTLRAFRD